MAVQQKIKARLDMLVIIQGPGTVWDQLRNTQSIELTSQGEERWSQDTMMQVMSLNMIQSIPGHIAEINKRKKMIASIKEVIARNQAQNPPIIGPVDLEKQQLIIKKKKKDQAILYRV